MVLTAQSWVKERHALCMILFVVHLEVNVKNLLQRLDKTRVVFNWIRFYFCKSLFQHVSTIESGDFSQRWQFLLTSTVRPGSHAVLEGDSKVSLAPRIAETSAS